MTSALPLSLVGSAAAAWQAGHDITNREGYMHKRILKLLPRKPELCTPDYRDNLDEHVDLVARCVAENDWSALDEQVFEWFDECRYSNTTAFLECLIDDIAYAFNVSRSRAAQFVADHEDELREELEERDVSNPLHDLLRNSAPFVAFYRLGYDVEQTWCMDAAEYSYAKSLLHEALQTSAYDDEMDELLANATNGGDLVVYFHLDPLQFVDSSASQIEFSDPHVAIINTQSGSGHDAQLVGHTLRVPFKRGNIGFDRQYYYNYTYAVCGNDGWWCEGTAVKLLA